MRCRILAGVGLLCRPDIGTNQNYFTPITATTTTTRPGLFTILVLLLLFVGLSRMSRPILVHIGTEHLNKVYQFEWLMLMGDGSVCGLCSTVVVHQRIQWWMRDLQLKWNAVTLPGEYWLHLSFLDQREQFPHSERWARASRKKPADLAQNSLQWGGEY